MVQYPTFFWNLLGVVNLQFLVLACSLTPVMKYETFYSLTPVMKHETSFSLTPVMKGINHRNSLIPIMNLYSNRNLPLLAIFPTAIAIVSGLCQCSNITTPSMYSRGSGARRS